MKQQKVVSNGVFALASNLFGLTDKREALETEIATDIAIVKDNRIKAVFPAIIEEAFAQTMDNYRKYVAAYNLRVSEENNLITNHNKAVKSYCKDTKLSEIQLKFLPLFYRNNSHFSDRQYNDKVDEFCQEYGLIISKRKIQTVKYSTEQVFQNLLHLYNSQLLKKNTYYETLGIQTPRPIQELKVNSFLVSELKRNGVKSIDVCSKTVRNHRQRLQEAGVFVDYHFSGRQRPVELHINPEILVVLDLKKSNYKSAENQTVNPDEGNVLPDNNESTGTYLNKCEKKENVNNSQLIRSSGEALTPFNLIFTGTPPRKVEKVQTGAGEKNVKVLETLSDKLESLIIHPQELAVNLANQQYSSYKPIDIRHLYNEAHKGTLTNDEFRELAIQDFFKLSAPIWKHQTPYAGSWKKAINLYYQNKWVNFEGRPFQKYLIVQDIQEMRWRITWAKRWFLKNKFPALFPFDYFDMTRKTSKEVGFEYTKTKWKQQQAGVKKYDAIKSKQERDAKRRKETINLSKKYDIALKRFFKDKMTMPALFEYVERNFPPEFMLKLPDTIEQFQLQVSTKTILLDQEAFKITYSPYEF